MYTFYASDKNPNNENIIVITVEKEVCKKYIILLTNFTTIIKRERERSEVGPNTESITYTR